MNGRITSAMKEECTIISAQANKVFRMIYQHQFELNISACTKL